MILLIDNYDSFTFNLVQVVQKLGLDPLVVRNDRPELFALVKQAKKIIISPGPSNPQRAGFCLEVLKLVPKTTPVLGVCLGHQILGFLAGARVDVADQVMHGKTSWVYFKEQEPLFEGLNNPTQVCRYHSLLVYPEESELLEVTAWTENKEVMGLRYTDRPWVGVQFHPESILSPEGPKLIANFLKF
ncbi:MAG: anthranilate synthase component [Desulfonauticus sp.]|jgi:anthranilate synthase component 2|nr:MAG: Anthranilate synthase component II [Desulfonauticus sp. 38_4375]MDK2922308.1 anthranilate synthase component [Desulfonauticus sp.]